jgi:glycine dehydrogenase subunit 2
MKDGPHGPIYSVSQNGGAAFLPIRLDVPETALPDYLLRKDLALPELDLDSLLILLEAIRKIPPFNKAAFDLTATCLEQPGWRYSSSALSDVFAQGSLELSSELGTALKELSGFESITLQRPTEKSALAATVDLALQYQKGIDSKRTVILAPQSLARACAEADPKTWIKLTALEEDESRGLAYDAAEEGICPDTAGIIIPLTSPDGFFQPEIKDIAELSRSRGAMVIGLCPSPLVFSGVFKPAELGLDLLALCLEGRGTPRQFAEAENTNVILCRKELEPYLDGPIAERQSDGSYVRAWPERSPSLGRFFETKIRILLNHYIWLYSAEWGDIRSRCEQATLNANYLAQGLLSPQDGPRAEGGKPGFFYSPIFRLRLKLKEGVDPVEVCQDFERSMITVRGYDALPGQGETAFLLACDGMERKERLDQAIFSIRPKLDKEKSEAPSH